jgi:hypothetical protein
MKRIGCLLAFLILSGCNEAEDASNGADLLNSASDAADATITELPTSGIASVLTDYAKSSFSNYIYFHKTESKLLIDFAFFPDGSDPDSVAKTISIPCLSEQNSDDAAVAIGLSAPIESDGSCEAVSLSLLAATFTNDGLVFSFSEPFTLFASQYDFNITRSGFVDSQTSEAIAASVSSRLADVAE